MLLRISTYRDNIPTLIPSIFGISVFINNHPVNTLLKSRRLKQRPTGRVQHVLWGVQINLASTIYWQEVKLDTKFAIGELVKKKRTEKSWTQEKLSSEAGINNRFLQKIEAGDRTPSLITIFKLASALGITPEKIITPIWKVWQKKHQ